MIFLGIDIGTTNMKILLLEDNGKILLFNEIKINYNYFKDINCWSITPEELWACILKVFDDINTDNFLSTIRIEAICITGVGSSLVLLNRDKKSIFPIIYAFSDCFTDNYKDFFKLYYNENIEEITRKNLNKVYPLPKIFSLQRNKLLKKDFLIMSIVDYINLRLTNNIVTDYSIASRSLLFDEERKEWSSKIMNLLEIDCYNLPSIKKSGNFIGNVNKEISKKYKFLGEAKVFLGAHDYACAFFLIYDLFSDSILDYMGTTESLIFQSEDLTLKKMLELNILSESMPYHEKDIYIFNLGILGEILSGIRKVFCFGTKNSLINLENEIIFIPAYRNYILENKGFLSYLGREIKTEDILQSVFEGFAFSHLEYTESVINKVIKNTYKIIATGKPSLLKEFMRIKANILNNVIVTFSFSDIPILGTIKILMRNYSQELDFSSILMKNKIIQHSYYPDIEIKNYYLKKYSKYQKTLKLVNTLIEN